MRVQEALSQVSELKLQLARLETYRGFRSAPVAFSGVVAGLGAVVQARLIPNPSESIQAYLVLWITAAFLSVLATAAEIVVAYRRRQSLLLRQSTLLTVEQFAPALLVGGALTTVLYVSAPGSLWMLPGLWQLVFSLGVFACLRRLPAGSWGIAVFYVLTGSLCLALAKEEWGLSPIAMGAPFGLGQMLAAGLLYFDQESTR